MITTVCQQLVDTPAALGITVMEGENTTVFTLTTSARCEVGQLLGKQGRTINALRTLTHAIGNKNGKRMVILLEEY